uniref:Signal transducer and activator of transcription n=2 Tax=Culex pipiens complex TaxID=518105 RepID=A0A904MVA4_CULQU
MTLQPVLAAIGNLYGVTFPASVQPTVAQYILAQLRTAPFNQQLPEPILEQTAISLFNDLLTELDRIALTLPPGDILQVQLSTAVAILRQLNPLQLYMTLIEFGQPPESSPPTIDQQANALQQMVRQCEAQIGSIAQMTTPLQRQPAVTQLTRDLWIVVERATDLASQIIGTYLRQWRIGQDRHGLDRAGLSATLDTIQRACEVLASVVWAVRDQIVALPVLGVPVELAGLFDRTRDLLALLATKCFVVECQPPRVIKTNTKYSVGVRHLLGGQLHSRMVGMKLQTCIVSESQARNIQQSNIVTMENSGVLTFDDGALELDKDSKHLKATFRNLQVKKIQRQERRGADSVTDEKFAFLFDLAFAVGDLRFSVWTISQPVVVIVHGNQETAAKATIVWDNAFADPSRIPFEISERMGWNVLAEMLNRKFRSMLLDRPLSAENLHFLGVKATRRKLPFPVPDAELVTRAQFCRDLIPARPFTFWEWFYAAIKVTRDSLKDIWNDGHMVGFVDKARAEQDLRQHPPGTFLLRFSDSQQGGITIAYVTNEPSRRIQHINPFIGKDAVNAINAIRDLPQLKFVYPGVPKEEAFGRYFRPKVLPVAGYVPAEPAAPNLATQADGLANNQSVNSSIAKLGVAFDDFQSVDLNQNDLMEF